ncbi:metal ABC transporter permease [Alkalilacustris brevis]|uniref:metal ABC transporter permease n=1 Tax=Alkalilacustris brevis TaxID=2026338 RepID=UPI000E0D1D3C|nr:metal ABC transporter permease [Alkalilacustris brevis]
MTVLAWLSDYTLQTVMMGAVLLGVVSGVLGSFAVLRRQSLMGDVLSHAALPGICLGFLVAGGRELGGMLAGAFAAAGLAALCVLLIARQTRLKTDAALGIVLSVFFAVGVVLLSYVQSRAGAGQAGLTSFLFGQAAAILRSDLWLMGAVTALALAVVLAFWKEFKLTSFDPGYAVVAGYPVLALEIALTVMIALAIVLGLQMVGVVLMTAMVIAPAAAARQWVRRLEAMVLLAALFGVVAGLTGAVISAQARGLATGPLIVLVATGIVAVSLLLAPGRGVLWSWAARLQEARRLRTRQVLLTLHRLAEGHGDPAYPSEQGMVDAYHGAATRRALSRLAARGLVRDVGHHPETAPHWELTDAGHAEARRLEAGANDIPGAESAAPEVTGGKP